MKITLKYLNDFWETSLKGKHGFTISEQDLIIEIGLVFGSAPRNVKEYIWLLTKLGLIRKSNQSKYIYEICPIGINI